MNLINYSIKFAMTFIICNYKLFVTIVNNTDWIILLQKSNNYKQCLVYIT